MQFINSFLSIISHPYPTTKNYIYISLVKTPIIEYKETLLYFMKLYFGGGGGRRRSDRMYIGFLEFADQSRGRQKPVINRALYNVNRVGRFGHQQH